MADNDTPIICNGFKDDEYIEMAMLAQKMGRKIIPVVEKYTELHLILKYSAARGRAARRSAFASSWPAAARAAGNRRAATARSSASPRPKPCARCRS